VYTLEYEEFKELPPRGLAVLCEDVAFSEEAILDKLNNLKVNKSQGPDSVQPRILYEVRYQLITPLHMIFETFYNIGLIVLDWKFADSVLIYKKGNKAEVNNYRSVSRTNVVCKVIINHVMKYFLNNDLFSIRQYVCACLCYICFLFLDWLPYGEIKLMTFGGFQ